MEYERPTFPELKLWHPIQTVKLWGQKICDFVGIREQAIHQIDHYELTVDNPKPNVSVYKAVGVVADTVEQLNLQFEQQTLGDVPDIKGRDLPPFDSEGTYLNREV